jgi:hypothetical protein
MVGRRRLAAAHRTVKGGRISCPHEVAEAVGTECPPGPPWNQV